MNSFLNNMANDIPVCGTKSKAEEGHYGTPHLVLLRDERFFPSQVTLSILVPYLEIFDEDGRESTWLNWVDSSGNTYNHEGFLQSRKWVLLDEVDPEVLELFGLQLPSKEKWDKVMT
jgi:hypothetical protein